MLEISTFEHEDLSKYINKLVLPIHLIKADEKIKDIFEKVDKREKFNMVCMLINAALVSDRKLS